MDAGQAVSGTATAAATMYAAKLDYDAAKEANATALKQREEAQKFIEKQTNQARGDIFQLFPAGQKARQQGIQSGFDLYKAALPTQTQYFQQGNIQAQNQQLAGLGQIQNAILGRPINQNALKAGNVGQMDYDANGGLQRFAPVNQPILQPSGSSTNPNFAMGTNPAAAFLAMGTNPAVAFGIKAPPIQMQTTGIAAPAAAPAQLTSGATSIPSGTNGGGIQQYGSYVPDNPDWQYTPEGMAYYGFTD